MPDQSIILRTMAGDIRLQNNAAPKLQPGDKLTIDLPAGQPPRQAIIRPPSLNIPSAPPTLPPPVTTTPLPGQPAPPATRPPLPVPVPIPVTPEDGTIPNLPLPRIVVSPPPFPLGQTLRLTPVATPGLLPSISLPVPVAGQVSFPPITSLPTRPDVPQQPLQSLTPPPFSGVVVAEGIPLRTLAPSSLPPQLRLPPALTALLPPADPDTPQPAAPLTSRTLPTPSPFSGNVAQDMKVIATLPPLPTGVGFTDDTPLSLLRPGQQMAIVTGMTARQQPVLTMLTQTGRPVPNQPPMILHYPTQSMPVGTRVILGMPQAQALPPEMLAAAKQPLFLPSAWPAFTQVLLLAGASLSPLLERQFPRVGPSVQTAQMTGPAALLLSLMRGGTFNESFFMPDAAMHADMERQGVLKALQSILQDATQVQSKTLQDQDGQTWRPIPLPLLTDTGQMERAILYIPHQTREEQKKTEKSRDGKAVRFVLAARLSRMGDLQLEGLYRENGKTLDVQVASEHPFSDPARTHIAQVYARALTRSDLTGDIFFHLKNSHWRDFTDPQPAPAGSITA